MDSIRLLIAIPLALFVFVLLTILAIILTIALGVAYLFKAEKSIYQLGSDVGAAGGSVVRFILQRKR